MGHAEVPEAEWVTILAESLARDVHSDQDALVNYQTLKDATLRAYGVTAASGQIKLHQLRYHHKGNFRQHVVQIQTLLRRWLEPSKHPGEDDAGYFRRWKDHQECELTMDFALRNLFGDLKQHVLTRNPKTIEEFQ
jgi:hypothetical protein